MVLRAATRASALALWQTRYVAGLLGDEVAELEVSTIGDRRVDVPIHTLGGKGVFVKEVQAAVIDGRADFAVHSAKDLPALEPPELVLVAVPERADPRDALVGARLNDLRLNAIVATGSIRRRVQLARLRPDIIFEELRGNIGTRMAKASRFDAIVMAAAAIDRLDLEFGVVDRLDPSAMVPQVAQGALAVECRADDSATIEALRAIDDPAAHLLVDAERSFLAELGGDCNLPAGAYAVAVNSGIEMTAMLASDDAQVQRRCRQTGPITDPGGLGRCVARRLLEEVAAAPSSIDKGQWSDPR